MINRRVIQTNPRSRASRRPGYKNDYVGAKDLLGVNAAYANKELVMGIGAANRFRRGSRNPSASRQIKTGV